MPIAPMVSLFLACADAASRDLLAVAGTLVVRVGIIGGLHPGEIACSTGRSRIRRTLPYLTSV
jgi:hypothetical protein